MFALLVIPTTEPKIPELLDQLITGPITPWRVRVSRALRKAVIERAMSAKMNEHLGYMHDSSVGDHLAEPL